GIDGERVDNHVPAVWQAESGTDARRRLPVLLRVPRLPSAAEAEARGLLRVLLVRLGQVPADAGKERSAVNLLVGGSNPPRPTNSSILVRDQQLYRLRSLGVDQHREPGPPRAQTQVADIAFPSSGLRQPGVDDLPDVRLHRACLCRGPGPRQYLRGALAVRRE